MAKVKATKGLTTQEAPDENKDGSEKDYEAENHYSNIERAHATMQDDNMMARVRKVAGRKAKAATGLNDMLASTEKVKVNTIADLKNLAKNMRVKKG